jgi:hypothetical protein
MFPFDSLFKPFGVNEEKLRMRQLTVAAQHREARAQGTRELFLEQEQDRAVARVGRPIEPHDPPLGHWQPRVAMSIMLRMYFLKRWFSLSAPSFLILETSHIDREGFFKSLKLCLA